MKKLLHLFLVLIISSGIMDAAITVRLEPSSCSAWSVVNLYAWVGSNSEQLGSWPGTQVTKDNDGWYYYTFADNINNINIIWNNGQGSQTIDICNVTESTCYALNSTSGGKIAVSIVDCSLKYTQIGGLYYNLYADKTAEVASSGSNKYSGDIVIPATVEYNAVTYSVTSIGRDAFSKCTGLTSIEIPNSVISIGENAFSGCTGLPVEDNLRYADTYLIGVTSKTLSICTIKEGTKWIGDNAFYGCYNLTSVTIPNSVTSIGNNAFDGCSALTTVEVPNNITSIGDYAFSWCISLSSVTIPNSVTSIGNNAFDGCSGLVSPVYNAHVFAFMPKSYMGAYTILDGIESIAGGAFNKCEGLTSVEIPNSVTSIGDGAFEDCSSLTSVTIGNSVTSIGGRAFYGCTGLTSITIPNSVTSIGEKAFCGCTGLTSVTIPNSVTSIGNNAFDGCSGLTDIYTCGNLDNVRQMLNNDSRVKYVPLPYSISTVAVNGNVQTLQSACDALDLIALPNYGYEFIQWSDGNTDNPRTIVPTGDTTFTAVFGTAACPSYEGLISEMSWKLDCNNILTISGKGVIPEDSPWREYQQQILSVVIDEGITSIGDHAFDQYNNLSSVLIPNSVTSIGESAFSSCKSLTSVEIPNSVTSIGDLAFVECSGLTSVTIPNSVTSIEGMAFHSCNLTKVVIGNGVSSIGDEAFGHNEFLQAVTIKAIIPPITSMDPFWDSPIDAIYVPCGTTDTYKAASGWSDYASAITTDLPYTITDASNNGRLVTKMNESATCDEPVVTCTATPNNGYHFIQWSDGVTDNPRIIELSQDTTLIAEFAKNPVATFIYDAEQGYVDGEYTTATGLGADSITFTAIPNHGYYFVRWSDGITDNPRTIYLERDTTFTAEFAQTFSGQCGDALYWEYANNQLVFSGSGAMYDYNITNVPWALFAEDIQVVQFAPAMTTIGSNACANFTKLSKINLPSEIQSIGAYAFSGCTAVDNLTIPNAVTELGKRAFENCARIDTIIIGTGITTITNQFRGCTGLRYLQLGQSVTNIDYGSFYDARQLIFIVCHPILPPLAYPDEVGKERSFYNTNAQVLIPCDNFDAYQYDALWGSFNLKCLSSNSGTAIDGQVTVIPGDADATFTWPTDGGANTYNLEITKDGVVFCTLTFNSQGQLQGIHFAPSTNGTPHNTPSATLTTSGMTFQVTGLDYASQYRFSFETKDATKTLFAYTGGFSTNGAPQGIDDVESGIKAQKLVRDGQVLILRGEKTYTVTGQEVK